MEGKEKKVKLSTILVVLVVIAIICIGIYILKTTKSEGNNQVEDNTTNNIIDNAVANNTLDDEDIEEKARELIEKYLKLSSYENSNIGPMPYLLAELGLETKDNLDLLCEGIDNSSEYIKSNVNYQEFKSALLEYVTEDYFINHFSQYKNIDGYVGFCNCAAGIILLEVEDIELSSENKNEYIFDVTFKDVELYEHYLNGEEISEDEYLFNEKITLEYINNKLVISDFFNEEIVLEGVYAIEASDVGYEFYSDGTVEFSTNMTLSKGTYTTVGEGELEIVFTERIIWDEELSGKTTTEEINEIEKVKVIDENKLIVESEYNGEVYSNELIKF